MHIKTLLNRLEKHKGFVYQSVRLIEEKAHLVLEVTVRPRKGCHPVCSVCGQEGSGYDTLPLRRFEFVPFWGIVVFFAYAMRRVDCPTCGVKVEAVPWANGNHRQTKTYAWFLASWAKRLSWSEVAEAFHTSWHHVFTAVRRAVAWGRSHMNVDGVTAIGIDEMAWGRWHRYVTVVYQINEGRKRLLWIGRERTVQTLLGFFGWFGQERSNRLAFICSDMWKPYLKVIGQKAGGAVHILDRFHIMAHLNKALDQVRAEEARELKAQGLAPVLKGSRWLFLKRFENMTFRQIEKLAVVLSHNLRAVRSYLMKEEFLFFWEYKSPYFAGRFLDQWCERTMRSRLEPMKDVARMLRRHRELILNWFRAKKAFSSGVVEGLNGKAKLITKRAYGFRTHKCLEIAMYHGLGQLPEPEFTHKFF
jgi:transposase